MNKNLEESIQEHNAYLERNGLTASTEAIARHFYKLALVDVKDMLEKKHKIHKKARKTATTDITQAFFQGAVDTYNSLLFNIENQIEMI